MQFNSMRKVFCVGDLREREQSTFLIENSRPSLWELEKLLINYFELDKIHRLVVFKNLRLHKVQWGRCLQVKLLQAKSRTGCKIKKKNTLT